MPPIHSKLSNNSRRKLETQEPWYGGKLGSSLFLLSTRDLEQRGKVSAGEGANGLLSFKRLGCKRDNSIECYL